MKKTAVLFLTIMAVLTFLSRALDSVTVTRVETGYGKQGIVSYEIEGTGEFAAGRFVYITLPEDMQIAEKMIQYLKDRNLTVEELDDYVE